MIRPEPTHWFELLVARDDTTLALVALAGTGAVELETRDGHGLPATFADLRAPMAQFNDLALRLRAFWPAPGQASTVPEPPLQTLQRCIARLRAWAAEAEPAIRRLQQAQADAEHARPWLAALDLLDAEALDLGRVARAGPQLMARLFTCPADAPPPWADRDAAAHGATADSGALLRTLILPGRHAALAVGTPAQLATLGQQVLAQRGEVLPPPAWLSADRDACRRAAAQAQQGLEAAVAQARQALDALSAAHGLPTVLADAQRLQWVLDNVPTLETGPLFSWITGWTSHARPAPLEQAIERSGARALLRMPAPPAGKLAPLQLHNPWWARPFEVFSRAMGMPGSSEADPSVLLALAVPLMFGYMFGDVGQGLVIALAGWLLRGRFAMARLFIAGGLSAAFFGLLFGSVFSWHALHPWWVDPLADPLAVLVAPLVGGAVLLALGLLLGGLGAHWRGEGGRWLGSDAGLLLAYIGLLASLQWPAMGWLAGTGALHFCLGHGWQGGRAGAVLVAVGELVERGLQLLINTLSFARVGAFALAHAGLSSAIVALAQAAEQPLAMALVLLVGNVVVIVLEGLVVSIQTTRLVLFEFFARFLQGTGRVFHPLPLPPAAATGSVAQAIVPDAPAASTAPTA